MTSQGRFQIFLTPPVHAPYFNLSTLKVSKLYLKKCRSRLFHSFVGGAFEAPFYCQKSAILLPLKCHFTASEAPLTRPFSATFTNVHIIFERINIFSWNFERYLIILFYMFCNSFGMFCHRRGLRILVRAQVFLLLQTYNCMPWQVK